MKLKNKISGEIKEFVLFDGKEMQAGLTLENLTQEWEDYEEPKEYCYITSRGNFHFIEDIDDEGDKERKEIGNYFETKEEARQAVEKLKAWKRLRDRGFRFTGLSNESIGYEIKELSGDFALDLDLLFNGGEE